MKKWISIWLVLALLLCLPLPVGAEETPVTVTLTADRKEAAPGETVYVTLSVSEAVEDLITWQFGIGYDTTVFTMGTPSIAADAWPSTVAGLARGVGEAIFPVSALDVTGGAVNLNAGQVVTVPFTVKADAPTGEVVFSLNCEALNAYGDLADLGDTLTLDAAPATLTITQGEQPEHYDGYGVTLKPESTGTLVGENVTAKVQISARDEEVTTYNAYEFSLTYDTEKLTYVSGQTPDENGYVVEQDGVVTVLGYGKDKTLDTAAAMLTFTAKASGTAELTLSSAKVDISGNAPGQDVPNATVVASGPLTIREAYPVTLGEGLHSEYLVAAVGEDFTFEATDFGNYTYELPVAICEKKSVTVKDNGDGSYTIAGKDITGPISVTVQRSAKSYDVTWEGSGKEDVSQPAASATYRQDLVITLKKQDGYSYTLTATIGQQKIPLTADEKDTYTLPGTSVIGPVTITVERTAAGETEVPVTKPAWVTGDDKAKKGEDYSFTVTTEEGYTYGEPTVTIGDKTVTVKKEEDGSYTIAGKDITGPVTIDVSREATTLVEVSPYLTLKDGNVMWLVTVSGQIPEGSVPAYDGNTMFFSEGYDAYAWLLISDGNREELLQQAKDAVTMGEGTATVLSADGDVNRTGKTDINDAQLVYDLYQTCYSNFETVSREKFLRADVTGDKTITTQDAAAIVNLLQGN